MKIKTNSNYKRCIILSFIVLILSGCQKSSLLPKKVDNKETLSVVAEPPNHAIVFVDPVVEKEIRRILNKPAGEIYQVELLDIIEFGVTEEYENFYDVGIFGSVCDDIESLTDLSCLKNLKMLVLSGCNIKSLTGIEELEKLELLYVSRNEITSLEPIRKLSNLKYFNCSENTIIDYSPLSSLIKMESLSIGSDGANATDLSPLAQMTQLRSLSASWCGVSDITPLRNMLNLEYLNLSHNNVSDITTLENLKEINYLQLDGNKITDIKPILHLPNFEQVYFNQNLIPEDDLIEFYKPREEDYFVTTFYKSINENMPEFTFELSSYFNKQSHSYALQTLTVSNASDPDVRQVISLK